MTSGTKVGVIEQILHRFASTEAKILADHLHRALDDNGYAQAAKEIFIEGHFSFLDFIYLKLAAHQNMVQDTKNVILLNVLEVTKFEDSPKRVRHT